MKRYIFVFTFLIAIYAGKAFAQSAGTEGTDFWVTFLSADRLDGDDKKITLSLSLSSTQPCEVTIENPYTQQRIQRQITATNPLSTAQLYNGTAKNTNNDKFGCYTILPEQPINTAVHITSTANISVYASNYKEKSFDATNVLPTTALTDAYMIQTFPASDHGGKPQGSHFAVVATEDNTVVDIELTTKTSTEKTGTITTPSLKAGQVYYVWSGANEGAESDLSGTKVTARDNKRIAVFQGNPHTNLPYYKDYGWTNCDNTKDRDHLFSQAIPTTFWGTRYAITSSMTRKRDFIRIMAINDGTHVYIDGKLVHTFDFSVDKKQFWEFEIGETMQDRDEPLVIGESCFLETDCPTSVHLFMASNRFDGSDKADPAMVLINPIEQGISHVTFSTYRSSNTHYVNVVTEKSNCKDMVIRYTANGKQQEEKIEQLFKPVAGSEDKYYYARLELGTTERPYTLVGKRPFVAHVYGYGERESYGYSVGSAAVEYGINVDNQETVTEGDTCKHVFCVGSAISLDAQIGADPVSSVNWSFGEDYTINDAPAQIDYLFEGTGIYNITAKIFYGKDPCTGNPINPRDISFYIKVQKPDTVFLPGTHDCDDEAEPGTVYPVIRTDTNRIDCSRIEITPIETGFNTRYTIPETLIGQDSCLWLDKWYFESGTYIDTLKGGNHMRCDSILTCSIKVITCLKIENLTLEKDTLCPDDDDELVIHVQKRGDFTADSVYILLNNGKRVYLDVEERTNTLYASLDEFAPDIYNCTLVAVDTHCKRSVTTPLHFVIRYASDIFRQKWYDVLVVPKKDYNGGFDFTSYQWMKDGKPIAGATGAWYYVPDYGEETELDPNAEYSVVLTRSDGTTIESCSRKIEPKPEEEPALVNIHPTLLLPNDNINILADGECTVELYNTLGVKQGQVSFVGETQLPAPARSGMYILHITLKDGSRHNQQIVVK